MAGKQHPKSQPQRGPVDQRKRYRPPLADPEAHPHGQQADRHAERTAPEIGPPAAWEELGIFVLLEPPHPAGEGPLFKPTADRQQERQDGHIHEQKRTFVVVQIPQPPTQGPVYQVIFPKWERENRKEPQDRIPPENARWIMVNGAFPAYLAACMLIRSACYLVCRFAPGRFRLPPEQTSEAEE